MASMKFSGSDSGLVMVVFIELCVGILSRLNMELSSVTPNRLPRTVAVARSSSFDAKSTRLSEGLSCVYILTLCLADPLGVIAVAQILILPTRLSNLHPIEAPRSYSDLRHLDRIPSILDQPIPRVGRSFF